MPHEFLLYSAQTKTIEKNNPELIGVDKASVILILLQKDPIHKNLRTCQS